MDRADPEHGWPEPRGWGYPVGARRPRRIASQKGLLEAAIAQDTPLVIRPPRRVLILLLVTVLTIGSSHASIALRAQNLPKLVAAPSARSSSAEAQKQFDDIQKRFAAARAEFEAKMEAAKTDGERTALFAKRPEKEFATEFKALALAAKGTELAAKAWLQVAENGWSDEGDDADPKLAVGTLLADHSASPEMIGLISDGPVARRILTHLGLETEIPPPSPARVPPEREFA